MTDIFEMEKEFDALVKKGQELIEKLKKEKSKPKRWKPKDGETYWYIYGDGTIEYGFWTSKDNTVLGRYKLGNCFKTQEAAQKELDRRIAEQELLDMCDGSSTDCFWAEIGYDRDTDLFEAGEYGRMVGSCYHFATEESAQKAIDTLSTEKLKLIFRID